MSGTTLRITTKNFQDEEVPHKLFLKTKQTTQKRNAFAVNILANMKLSKAQIFTIIQSFGSWLDKISKKTNAAIPFLTDNLPELVSNISLNPINRFERGVSGEKEL